VHTAPMNPNIRERTTTNNATGYYADDCTDPDFFIEGSVTMRKGELVLTFIVLAAKSGPGGTTIRGKVKGSEFFEAMWTHFIASGTTIDVIQAEWTDRPLSITATFTTNLDAFNKAVLVYPTLEAAALHGTVTGNYSKKKNYTKVTIVSVDPPSSAGQKGPFKDAIVQFRQP
jgi:hypothetical protein